MPSDLNETARREVAGGVVSELAAVGFHDAVEVGRGGFGAVFRCVQADLARVVAVKLLTTDLADDRPRFVREQHAMGQLTGHPNIVPLLQVGQTPRGLPFLVMPFFTEDEGAVRFRLLDTLRDYGRTHLTDTAYHALQRRHATYYEQLLDQASAE